MKSPAKVVAEKIVTLGLQMVLGENLFAGSEPEKPAVCTTCYDTGGGAQNPKLNEDMVSVQVRHRNPSYDSGYTTLQNIRLALEGIAPYSNGDIKIDGIWVETPVAFIGRAKNEAALFTLNIRILLTPENPGHRQTY